MLISRILRSLSRETVVISGERSQLCINFYSFPIAVIGLFDGNDTPEYKHSQRRFPKLNNILSSKSVHTVTASLGLLFMQWVFCPKGKRAMFYK